MTAQASDPTYAGLVARMTVLADALHAEGRRATDQRRYVEGHTLRVAANVVREELGLDPIPYYGPPREEEQ